MEPVRFFDAHLDLAYLAVNGRDMRQEPGGCGGPHLPAACTFPSLAAGGVRACLGTIFTELGGRGPAAYRAGDATTAHAAGLLQLARYEIWAREGVIDKAANGRGACSAPLRVGLLIECADPIRTPEELPWWHERGVVAIGMAWARGSRYASGNAEPSCSSEYGLTELGRELVRRMDVLGIVHDVSHLSQRATDELLSLTDAPVVATHSNCRALLDGKSQRHLCDGTIREIGRRGGVVGLNLFAPFIRHDLEDGQRPSIGDAVRHVEHVCEVMGHRRGVGLGSDMDGGFSATRLPHGIDASRDLPKILRVLEERGWAQDDIEGFAWRNWRGFWERRGVEF